MPALELQVVALVPLEHPRPRHVMLPLAPSEELGLVTPTTVLLEQPVRPRPLLLPLRLPSQLLIPETPRLWRLTRPPLLLQPLLRRR